MVRVHPGQPDPQAAGAQAAGPARGTGLRTLVLGGTRSGKSGYAEALLPADAPVRYAATARRRPDDLEWEARIARHAARRPACWTTVEDPDLVAELARGGPLLVDDLATWLTGVLDDCEAWEAPATPPGVEDAVATLVEAVRRAPGEAPCVLVSAEVGLGVVPATRAGRLFRDELGALNAALAEVCDKVVLLVAGLPLRLKPAGG
ncbi:bifunctional adenosylcobinamide kinase/adenosylcobinamide-phosphate guanylyltransferase [Pseudonocardia lutea]|uniref:Adenosylcobinamide kinase n=1 Tax=Pseudonocardia lutea TaxID=2172015 RepID=A0ABW1IDL0_9PSEU